MYYLIYQTTNIKNGHFYIGYHKTIDLNDSYLGSGKKLQEAIVKYGKENFKRDILYIFPTSEEAFLKELEIVDEEFINRRDTYNLRIGGDGGWDYINNVLLKDPKYIQLFRERVSNGVKKAINEGKMDDSFRKAAIRIIQQNKLNPPFKGKFHSWESKKKISENNGSNLSQEEILKRLFVLKSIDFGYGWRSKLANIWGIPHQHVKKFLDKYLIGAKIKYQYKSGFYDSKNINHIEYGEVLDYFAYKDQVLGLKIGYVYFDDGEKIVDHQKLITVKEDILQFL